jgi:hypothetical protein
MTRRSITSRWKSGIDPRTAISTGGLDGVEAYLEWTAQLPNRFAPNSESEQTSAVRAVRRGAWHTRH